MNQVVEYQVVQGVATLAVSHPPVNALSHAVRCGLAAGLHQAMTDPDVVAILLYCKGSTFFVGADVTEFGKPRQPPLLRDLIQKPLSVDEKVSRLMALDAEMQNARICDYTVEVSTYEQATEEILDGLLPNRRKRKK